MENEVDLRFHTVLAFFLNCENVGKLYVCFPEKRSNLLPAGKTKKFDLSVECKSNARWNEDSNMYSTLVDQNPSQIRSHKVSVSRDMPGEATIRQAVDSKCTS